ncbi:MAG: pseudouridine synthase [bacterium]
MRINKYLARQGHATRRGADELIEAKKVLLNDRIAVLGDKVEEGDKVELRSGHKPKEYKYFAYHKPKGVITHSPQEEDEEDIKGALSSFPELADVFPVGRLDKASHGLIILTNDGRVTDRLLNPDHDHEKEYVVKTRDKLRPSFKEHMEKGVELEDGYVTKPAKVKLLGEKAFAVTLTEGKKHQIRRMVSMLHNDTVELKRTKVMNIALGSLPSGAFRPIEGPPLKGFLKALGIG